MPLNWLKDFARNQEKPENYAEKTLAAYKLGIRAGGSIRGVRVLSFPDCCQAAQELDPDTVYLPDDAPTLPLPECTMKAECRCMYRPVMKYEE
ncbi:MAG: hypothetical protein JXB38_17310 [Anaerolineales bacterium]|nr:hypothetical protein [Anaerolineales bacterium]